MEAAIAARMHSEQEIERIVREIIGAGIDVHRRVGPGCFESAYTPCLAYEMNKRGLQFDMNVPLDLSYEELRVPRAYVLDFDVEHCVIVEAKALELLAPVHARQLNTYLRISGYPIGLLMNFGAETMRDGIRRVVNNFPWGTKPCERKDP